ncbi:4Fe-4S dicluster domain-containing protein [Thermodesulfobacteriota bacterium]
MTLTGIASGISIHAKTCSGCRMCEQVCVFFHEREFNPRRARIKVLIYEKEGINAPLLCSQCKTCISSCNRDALVWDEKVGVVRVDAEKCNGCGICIDVCEEAAIFMDPITGIVNICDLCEGDPECIKWCPEDVLKPIDAAELKVESENKA